MNKKIIYCKSTVGIIITFLLVVVLPGCQTKNIEAVHSENNIELADKLTPTSVPQQSTSTKAHVLPTDNSKVNLPIMENDDVIDIIFTPTPTSTQFISPLAGIPLEDLSLIVSNPFDYAGDGKDEGHHGVDFSFYRYKTIKNIENLPVHSITSGVVRSVIDNRPPYGNMVIIETSFSTLPAIVSVHLLSQYPGINTPYQTNLSCPEFQFHENANESDQLSLYILYAHLFSPSTVEINSLILSGKEIGAVGNSGYSGNPHLHLEFRIGPSGYTFSEMAHYDNTASQGEIYNYCLWRVSGRFYQIDPMNTTKFYLQNR